MIDIITLLYILVLHWVADFVLQTDKQAINKSTDNKALLAHVSIYSGTMFAFLFLFLLVTLNAELAMYTPVFAIITFVAHFITDYFTSRLNARLWKEQKRHSFFVSVGFDQVLHHVQLVLTYHLISQWI